MLKKSLLLTLFFCLNSWASTPLEIIKLGHPTLRLQAKEVVTAEIQNPAFQALVDDMIVTMTKAGGVGLAAPQVNESLRVFVMKSWPAVALTVVINPKIEYLEEFGQKSSTEGCLSIPGKNLTVKRYKKIHLSYFDRQGTYVARELEGFGAIIAQHEYDHLNGVLIVDLIEQIFSRMNYTGLTDAPLM